MNKIRKQHLSINSSVSYTILIVLSISWPLTLIAQASYTDSLRKLIRTLPEDTVKLNVLERLSGYYASSWPDSSIQFSEEGLVLASKLDLPLKQFYSHANMVIAFGEKGNFSLSLEHALRAQKMANNMEEEYNVIWSNVLIGVAYFYAEDYRKALFYARKSQHDQEFMDREMPRYQGFLGETYYHLGEFDSALFYTKQSYDHFKATNGHWSVPCLYMGKLAERREEIKEALSYYKESVNKTVTQADYIKAYLAMAGAFKRINNSDSCIYYAKQAYQISKTTSLYRYSYQASELLKSLYKQNNQIDSAFKYQELMLVEKDSLFNREKMNQMQTIVYEDEKRQEDLKNEQERFNNRLKLYTLIAGLILILVVVFILIRNNRFKQRAYNLLQKQKSDIDEQKSKVELTLSELKSTQSQLIQSEKMASLGELTAGIAHEIQNPLNFVNNFSEVNKELVVELQEELKAGKIDDAISISNDIKDNEEKINHHGKRADAIVKGMLQHSRSSTGQKEPTDINVLCDEYLRLSYHGLRAKDKSFNAKIETAFDLSLPQINVVPQDIGRVVLNLINNAFYAVTLRQAQGDNGYEPAVIVTTKKKGNSVLISVKDNGNGIPDSIKEKIFQPFFTTKPTGSGTGLGLSLSYDIVKAHGGEIKVTSEIGKGSEFVILLPISNSKI